MEEPKSLGTTLDKLRALSRQFRALLPWGAVGTAIGAGMSYLLGSLFLNSYLGFFGVSGVTKRDTYSIMAEGAILLPFAVGSSLILFLLFLVCDAIAESTVELVNRSFPSQKLSERGRKVYTEIGAAWTLFLCFISLFLPIWGVGTISGTRSAGEVVKEVTHKCEDCRTYVTEKGVAVGMLLTADSDRAIVSTRTGVKILEWKDVSTVRIVLPSDLAVDPRTQDGPLKEPANSGGGTSPKIGRAA